MIDTPMAPPPQRLATKRLAGSWAKLDRAHAHVDELRKAIVEASDGRGPPRILGTRREYDAETEDVLFIAERMTEVGDDWGLIIGDAVHNLRVPSTTFGGSWP